VRSRPRAGPGAFWSLLRRLPRGFLLASPLGAVLEQLFSGLDAVLAPPAIASGRLVVPLETLSGEVAASLQLVKREARRLLTLAKMGSGFCFSLGSVLAVTCFGELSADSSPGPPYIFVMRSHD